MIRRRVLTTAQRDRAVGAVVGMAVGDALGAGYEFQSPVPAEQVAMTGGGLGSFAEGEWTDDTTMAMPILEALARGVDLLEPDTADEVARCWIDWATHDPKDIGINTGWVLCGAAQGTAEAITARAAQVHADGGRAAGNGSLMRTTPIVLGYLDDPRGLTEASRLYSDMTHGDPVAADACVLWNHAQRDAILHGRFDVRVGLCEIPADRRGQWDGWLTQAEEGWPEVFARRNSWVVAALQQAWSGIVRTPASGPAHLAETLRILIAAGSDTDTVAAIAGGLLGARWGVSGIPLSWRRVLHGWPGDRTGQQLAQLASAAATGHRWPDQCYAPMPGITAVRLPHDEGVWIGDVFGLQGLPEEVTAVVSLCRLGKTEGPIGIEPENHVNVWLIDDPSVEQNPHLEYVARQAVSAVASLRSEGKRVYLHCVHARSRTPFIATLYAAQVTGRPASEVLAEVLAVLPGADPNPAFRSLISDW